MLRFSWFAVGVVLLLNGMLRAEASETSRTLKVEQQSGRLVISHGSKSVATYVFGDGEILRPYFAHVNSPDGLPLTRQHPPREGVDATDHATMHPGIWLAFGDLGGGDFWRNKGRVEHVEFVKRPQARVDDEDGVITFTAKNRYVAGDKLICYELARHTLQATRSGYLLTFDSRFFADEPFALGDQEEMGLGIRVATPLAVKGGGAITNNEGRVNEEEVWGRQADWCDYSGTLTAKMDEGERKLHSGVLVVPHPGNFRRSWMHARDYGVLVANPFGQNAFSKGERSRVEVKPGEELRLRFGVWLYSAKLDEMPDLSAMADQYVRLAMDD